jgi:exopolysaccharide biosynthesis polyprenyl glycosylphosphotransferase
MLRSHAGRLHSLILAIDHVLSGASAIAVLAIAGTTDALESEATILRLLAIVLLATVLWPILFEYLGLYQSQRRTSIEHVAVRLVLAAGVSALVIGLVGRAIDAPLPPGFPAVCAAFQLAALGTVRLGVMLGLRLMRRTGRNFRNVLVVGSGPRARQARQLIEEHPTWGLRILGFVDDSDSPVDPALADARIYKFSDLPVVFREAVIDEVVVACPRTLLASVEPVISACASVGVPVTVFSDLFGDFLPPPRVSRFGAMPALSFAVVHHNPFKLSVKRALDVTVAGLALALASPVIAVAALSIKWTSPGPVFFRQQRCGLNGRPFEILKLRTMYVDAEQRRRELLHLNEASGPVFKIRNDPRVTPAGRFLRRWSLDELPQLWNVLRGDMSLVGPRPPIPEEVAQYEICERRRLSMRPGLTCLWQVNGRSQIAFQDWVRMDLEYIDRWSLGSDLRILARTVPAVLRGTGAS